ncbi:MAG TPA: hypothetical protein VKC54_02470 [Patescibacteria group bacterium]|nr:hypothetical protein [Patescibacteria group bacterium]
MSAELIIRGAEGVASGLVSSLVTGALDSKRAKEGNDGLLDVVVTTGILTGACTLATIYLNMPVFVPLALSVIVRVGHEARELYLKVKGNDENL